MTLSSILWNAVAGAAGAWFLHAYFAMLRTDWPASYYSVSDLLSSTLSARPHRYLIFRGLPVFTVVLFVAVTVEKSIGSSLTACSVLVILHIADTSGRASAPLLRGNQKTNRRALLAFHMLVAAVIACVATAAYLLRGLFGAVVPSLSEMRSDLWTALVAAVLAGYFIRVSEGASHEAEIASMRASRRSIDEDVWRAADELSSQFGTDAQLIRAIMLIENLQRPPWFRRLERIKGAILPRGTYGLMQVAADNPLGDAQSVAIAVRDHLAGIERDEDDFDWLPNAVSSYNPDPAYVEAVLTAFWYLEEVK